jgi:two-component system, LytTR family, response regulator
MRAIIVEDEQTGIDNLLIKLGNNCPGVEIIATCKTGEEAVVQIASLQPDLIFLDVSLGSMTGFDVLARVQHVSFEVIFTTAYDNYAIKAIKNNALDYLLKPFTEDELKAAVQKAWAAVGSKMVTSKQIALNVGHTIRMVNIEDIIWIDAADNNCKVYIDKESEPLKSTRPLKDVYAKLPRPWFFKPHRSYVVNRNYIDRYDPADGYLHLKNKKKVSVARGNKDELLSWLGV